MSTVKNGDTVKVHYKGTLDDGTEFDNSRARGDTLEFEVGSGQLINGFDTAVEGMGLGEVKTVTIKSTDAYGTPQDEAFQDYPKSVFGPDFEFTVDGVVQGTGPEGQPVMARIAAINEDTVTLDHNHPLAGKDLTFEIELIDIAE